MWDIALLSATIQLGMLPLLALYFHRVSLVGPLANIPAVVLTGLIVPLGFLTLAASFLSHAASAALARVLGWLVTVLAGSVDWFAGLHWSSYRIPGPPWWVLTSFLITLACMAAAARTKRRNWQIVAAVPLAALLFVVATYPFAPKLERGKLEVTVIDVGQGDSLFVGFPDGHTMLIDGGGTPGYSRQSTMRIGLDTGEQVVSPYLWRRGVKHLDVVALTHAHQDHIGGLAAVLDNFQVEALWLGRDADSNSYRALIQEARVRGVPVIHHTQGDLIAWPGVEDHVLWPVTSQGSDPPKNDDSLVLRLVYGKTSMLLAGDVERPVENSLLHDSFPLNADFLKVGHHGSKTSTTPAWLWQVGPKIAAISVGENNSFGHPNAEVIGRLETAGVHIYRTDRDGAITIVSDGRSLAVRTFLHSPRP
jgi:competence protein ComEC